MWLYNKMATTQAIIEQMLQELGLLSKNWTKLDTIDAGVDFVLENRELLDSLPKRIVGDLRLLSSDVALVRRKSLLSLCRRMAAALEGAIIRKRTQVRDKKLKKTISHYSYKYITA